MVDLTLPADKAPVLYAAKSTAWPCWTMLNPLLRDGHLFLVAMVQNPAMTLGNRHSIFVRLWLHIWLLFHKPSFGSQPEWSYFGCTFGALWRPDRSSCVPWQLHWGVRHQLTSTRCCLGVPNLLLINRKIDSWPIAGHSISNILIRVMQTQCRRLAIDNQLKHGVV